MAVTKLFGNTIPPSCDYCSHNKMPDGSPVCAVPSKAKFAGQIDEDGNCPFFSYDPLLRKPKVLPPLQRYNKEDFSL